MEFVVEQTTAGDAEEGFVMDLVPEVAAQMSWGALISREHVEAEIDVALVALRGTWEMEPDQVMRLIAAISARMTELAVHLHRLEGKREWRQLRTMQADKVIQECDRQFRIASRTLEVRRQDLELLR